MDNRGNSTRIALAVLACGLCCVSATANAQIQRPIIIENALIDDVRPAQTSVRISIGRNDCDIRLRLHNGGQFMSRTLEIEPTKELRRDIVRRGQRLVNELGEWTEFSDEQTAKLNAAIAMDAARAAREYRIWVQAVDDAAAKPADVRRRMSRVNQLTDSVHRHVYSSHSLFCKVLAQQTTDEQKGQLKAGYFEWICEHVAELDKETKPLLIELLNAQHRNCWLGLTSEQYAAVALNAIPRDELDAKFSKRQAHIIRVFAQRILTTRQLPRR